MVDKKYVKIGSKPAWKGPNEPFKYEYTTTSAGEYVHGRILSKGTADSQVKLYAGGVPLGVGDIQSSDPGYNSSNIKDSHYAGKDTFIDMISEGGFQFVGTLKSGESVTKGGLLDAEVGTGKLVAHVVGGQPVARAYETLSASADTDIECRFLDDFPAIGSLADATYTTETVTVTTNVGTLTNTPILIEYIEVSAGTGPQGDVNYLVESDLAVTTNVATLSNSPIAFMSIEGTSTSTLIAFKAQTGTIAASGCVQVDTTSKTLTFLAADAVQTGTVKVAYLYRDSNKTGLIPIVNGTVRRGEAKLNYSSKTITCNASDAVTQLKVRYGY